METKTRGNWFRMASTALARGACRPETVTDLAEVSNTVGRTAKGTERRGRRTSCLFFTSMRSSNEEKKSDPSMGRGTSAIKKLCSTLRDLKHRGKRVVPKVLMAESFAATNDLEEATGEDLGINREDAEREARKTETSAPLSTRKRRPESSSRRDMAPKPEVTEKTEGELKVMPGANAARRERFPEAE